MCANAAREAARWIATRARRSSSRAARIRSRSIQPARPIETSGFVNRAVDALYRSPCCCSGVSFDGPNPHAHRRLRDAEASSDLLDRKTVLRKRRAAFPLLGFHTRQRTATVGRNEQKRASGIEPPYPGWKPG